MATETVAFVAPDIHCDGCATSIRRSLGKMAGVQAVDVHVGDRTVTVSFDPGVTSPASLRERLEQAGFPAE